MNSYSSLLSVSGVAVGVVDQILWMSHHFSSILLTIPTGYGV